MNVDAAFCADTGEAAAGVVFRNHSEEPIAAASSVLEGCNDAEEAKAIAVLTGMKLAVQLNLKPAIVESDNAGVVKALNGIAPLLGTNWHIYRNILQLRRGFPGCVFSKVNRLGNGVAHELASVAQVSRNSVLWLPPFPDFIKFICNSDYVSDSVTIN
jgi:ribonuclease HI